MMQPTERERTDEAVRLITDLRKQFGVLGARRIAYQVLIGLNVTPSKAGATTMARIRWRAPWWNSSASTRTEMFTRPADAEKAAQRLFDCGFEVELAHAERAPWSVIDRASFTPRSTASFHTIDEGGGR